MLMSKKWMLDLISKNAVLTVAVTMAAGVASSLANAGGKGNGGGYDGGEFSGISIPVADGRDISFVAVRNAIRVCLVEGDSKRGLVSALAPIHQALFGTSLKNIRGTVIARNEKDAEVNGRRLPNAFGYGIRINDKEIEVGSSRIWDRTHAPKNLDFVDYAGDFHWESYGPLLDINLDVSGNETPTLGLMSYDNRSSYDGRSCLRYALAKNTFFPAIRFKSISYPKGFRSGSTIRSNGLVESNEDYKALLHGVYVQMPKPAKRIEEEGRLYVDLTYRDARRKFKRLIRKTNLRIDTRAYVECLQSELNRNAE